MLAENDLLKTENQLLRTQLESERACSDNLRNELETLKKFECEKCSSEIEATESLDASTPIFYGSGPKLFNWIFIIENSFMLRNIREDRKMIETASFVRGTALQIHRSMTSSKECSWNEYKEVLIKTFLPINYEYKVLTKIQNLKHYRMPFEVYVSKFLYLINQIPKMSEQSKIMWFKEGLRPKTRFEISMKDLNSFNDIMSLAIRLEKLMDECKIYD